MSRPDGPGRPRRPDWRAWVMVAWVAVFGVLYARMVVGSRAPKIRQVIRATLDRAAE